MISPATQPSRSRTGPYDPGRPIQNGEDELASCDNERDADQQAENDQPDMTVGNRGDGEHIVEAHDDVGNRDGLNRLPEARRRLQARRHGHRHRSEA